MLRQDIWIPLEHIDDNVPRQDLVRAIGDPSHGAVIDICDEGQRQRNPCPAAGREKTNKHTYRYAWCPGRASPCTARIPR